jgi:hypothetical protein
MRRKGNPFSIAFYQQEKASQKSISVLWSGIDVPDKALLHRTQDAAFRMTSIAELIGFAFLHAREFRQAQLQPLIPV